MPVSVPLTPGEPEQLVEIQLDGETYVLRARWNSADDAWYLDAWESDGVTVIARSLKLVLGVRIGRVYNHPLFQGGLFVVADRDVEAGLGDLGGRVKLVHFTAEDFFLSRQPL